MSLLESKPFLVAKIYQVNHMKALKKSLAPKQSEIKKIFEKIVQMTLLWLS